MPAINFKEMVSFDPITPGMYAARFDSYEEGEADTDGSPKVTMTFVIIEEGEFQNRKMLKTHSYKPSALWSFKQTCLALGADAEKFDDEELDSEELLDDIQGAECRLVVKSKIYEGEKRTEIRKVLAPAYEFAS